MVRVSADCLTDSAAPHSPRLTPPAEETEEVRQQMKQRLIPVSELESLADLVGRVRAIQLERKQTYDLFERSV
jgi:hypothetical protein